MNKKELKVLEELIEHYVQRGISAFVENTANVEFRAKRIASLRSQLTEEEKPKNKCIYCGSFISLNSWGDGGHVCRPTGCPPDHCGVTIKPKEEEVDTGFCEKCAGTKYSEECEHYPFVDTSDVPVVEKNEASKAFIRGIDRGIQISSGSKPKEVCKHGMTISPDNNNVFVACGKCVQEHIIISPSETDGIEPEEKQGNHKSEKHLRAKLGDSFWIVYPDACVGKATYSDTYSSPNLMLEVYTSEEKIQEAVQEIKKVLTKEDLDGKQVIKAFIAQVREEAMLEERTKIKEIMELYGEPQCDSLYHPKKYHHKAQDECLIAKKIKDLLTALED